MNAAGKRGMLALRPGKFDLMFGDLLDRPNLPTLPQRFGHIMEQPPGGFGMLGNDKAGDCVAAGNLHAIMVHAIATQRPIPKFSEATALLEYSKLLVAEGGLPWNAQDPRTDTGLDPNLVARYWRDTGLMDDGGILHKIDAFALIEDLNDLEYAAWFNGASGLGMMLPNTAEQQFNAGHVWDDMNSAPQPSNGHYVLIVDRNSVGNLVVLTWGKLHAATPAYIQRYWAGGVAFLSREYMLATGISPEGFNYQVLANYLTALGQGGK